MSVSLWDFRHCDQCRLGGCIVMSCPGGNCPCAGKHPDAHGAEAATLEPFLAFTDEHGEFLSRLFGPAADEPSSGPPYTHVHRLPETEEEMAAAPLLPSHTITRESE